MNVLLQAAQELQLVEQQVQFHGRSMEPFLQDEDELEVKPVHWSEVSVGDLVVYRDGLKFPVLRVLERSHTRLLARADNWQTFVTILPEALLGRVQARLRGSRRLSQHDWAWKLSTLKVLLRYQASKLSRSLGGQRIHDCLERVYQGPLLGLLARPGDVLHLRRATWKDVKPGRWLALEVKGQLRAAQVLKHEGTRAMLWHGPGSVRLWVWPEDEFWRICAWERPGSHYWSEGHPLLRVLRLAPQIRHTLARIRRSWSSPKPVPSPASDQPAGVFLDISSYCNLGCRMCPYLPVHQNPQRMDFVTFERLLPLLAQSPSVCLIGAGEPLMNRNLLPMLERIRAACPQIALDLTTNGTLLTESLSHQILSHGLRRIIVSLDGARAETAESIRLGLNFPKLLAQLEKLVQLRQSLARSTLLRFNCVAGLGVYPQLEEFVALAGRLGFDEIRFLEVQAATPEEAAENFLSGVRSDGGLQVRRAIRLASLLGVRLFWPVIEEPGCEHPYEPHLSEEGEVFPCCYYAHGRKIYQGGEVIQLESLSFGNVRDRPIEEIWASPAYRDFRREVGQGNFGPGCQACFRSRQQTSREFRERFGFV